MEAISFSFLSFPGTCEQTNSKRSYLCLDKGILELLIFIYFFAYCRFPSQQIYRIFCNIYSMMDLYCYLIFQICSNTAFTLTLLNQLYLNQFKGVFFWASEVCEVFRKRLALQRKMSVTKRMGILKTVELADFAGKNAKRIRILKTVGLADFAEKNAKRMGMEC